MTAMINRTPETSTGGNPSAPIVTVSVTILDDEHNVDVARVTVVPTLDVHDANEQYAANVADFADRALHVTRTGAPDEPYRLTEMTFPGRTMIAVERF